MKSLALIVLLSIAVSAQATEFVVGESFVVSDETVTNCESCVVQSTKLANGSVAIAWTDAVNGGYQVRTRVLDANEILSPIAVVDGSSFKQSRPTLVSFADSSFAVLWIDDQQTLVGKTFSDQGLELTGVQTLITAATLEHYAVVAGADGNIIIGWQQQNSEDQWQLQSQDFDPQLVAVATPANLATLNQPVNSIHLIPCSRGGLWVLVEEQQDSRAILALRYFTGSRQLIRSNNLDGNAGKDQVQAHVTPLQTGGFVITWVSSDAIASDIVAQLFDANGHSIAPPFTLVAANGEIPAQPNVSSLLDGGFLFTWRTNTQLWAQIFNAAMRTEGERQLLSAELLLSAGANSVVASATAINAGKIATFWRQGNSLASNVSGLVFSHDRSAIVDAGNPIADAGPDQLVHSRDTLFLDANASRDSLGGKQLSYQWQLLQAPENSTASVANAQSVKASFTPDSIGEFIFQLSVSDWTTGFTNSDTLSVYNYNNAAIGNAGPDQHPTKTGRAIQLNGRYCADADSDYLWYTWELIQKPANSNASLDNIKSVSPRFVPDVAGVYRAQLVVKDAWQHAAPDIVVINFNNEVPFARAQFPAQALAGETIDLNAANSYDNNQDTLSYRWEIISQPNDSDIRFTNASAVNTQFTPQHAGEYQLALIVNDGELDSAPFGINITVEAAPEPEIPNTPPTANAGVDQSYTVFGKIAQLDGRLSNDPENDTLNFNWRLLSAPAGSVSTIDDQFSPTPRLSLDVAGDYVLELIVADEEFFSEADQVTVSLRNVAPVAHAGADVVLDPLQLYTLNGGKSVDANGEAINYQWNILSQPVNAVAELTGINQVDPSFYADLPGEYRLQLIVSDAAGLNSAADELVIIVRNQVPVANAGADQLIDHIDTLVFVNGSASHDVDGQALSYRWIFTAKPNGSAASLINANTDTANFTADVHGDYQLSLIVNDGINDSLVDTVLVSVANRAPIANAGADQIIEKINSTVMLNASQSVDDDGQSLTYRWTFVARPVGSQAELINANTVEANFIADAYGDYQLALIVSDGSSESLADTVTVTLDNTAPTVIINDTMQSHIGDTVLIDASDSFDSNGDNLNYSWTLISRPQNSLASVMDLNVPGIDFSADVVGAYLIEVTVSDGLSEVSGVIAVSIIDVDTGLAAVLQEAKQYVQALDLAAFQKPAKKGLAAKKNQPEKLLLRQQRLTNKIDKAIALIDTKRAHKIGQRIQNQLIQRTDGCLIGDSADKKDLISDCAAQQQFNSILARALIILQDK